MLDVHVLSLPERRDLTFPRCVASILAAIEHTPFQVALHIVPAYIGHIGRARSLGYSLGIHPYVTSVDDDDWIEPEAFMPLERHFQEAVPAIYTREWTWQHGKRCTFDGRQNLRVFRRDIVKSMDFEPWPALDSTALMAHADTFGDPVRLTSRPYHYAVDAESSARRIIRSTPGLLDRGRSVETIHG